MKKNILWIVIIVIAAVLIWWFMSGQRANGPATTGPTGGDTTQEIAQDLQGLDTGDLDKEFQGIDQDLNQL